MNVLTNLFNAQTLHALTGEGKGFMKTKRETLACGCDRGYFLCYQASKLWEQKTALYHAALAIPYWDKAHDLAWEDYENKGKEYQEHFGTIGMRYAV